MTKANTSKLLEYATNFGIDLWLFKVVFIDCKHSYEKYTELWREICRIELNRDQFNDVKQLLKEYTEK